jgi:hypothetical protein
MTKIIQKSEITTILVLFGCLLYAFMIPSQSFGQGNQTEEQGNQAIQTCDPSYSGACVPPFPPDVNCPDVNGTNFQVNGTDPHRLDADNDGIACER